MQTQFQYITDLAKQYHLYSEQPETLYNAMNNLPIEAVADIFKEFGDPDRDFQPVNLLRAEIARRLLAGESANERLVEEIKDKIRTKDTAFFSHYKNDLLEQLKEYELSKRDLFANWQKPWTVFHSFFYRNAVKETTRKYLEEICKGLLEKLDLEDFTYHWVDFQGASNFGSDFGWLALYPDHKSSHRIAYQFFLRLSAIPEAGRVAGFNIKDPEPNKLKGANNFEDVVNYFQQLRGEII